MPEDVKDIVILGGPNGSGKTTAAQVLLPQELEIREFVNADEIARGLSPFNAAGAALAAGRLMLERMRILVRDGRSFAFETTCSGRTYVRLVRQCRTEGWRVTLLYLWLPSPQTALDRVARRVREGGHDIPADVVVRRYWAGLANMRHLYLPVADVAAIYDNSDGGRVLIVERTPGAPLWCTMPLAGQRSRGQHHDRADAEANIGRHQQSLGENCAPICEGQIEPNAPASTIRGIGSCR